MKKDSGAADAEIRKKLDDLQHLKAELDGLDTQIVQMVPKVETLLDGLRLGVSISTKIDEDEQSDWSAWLAFKKFGIAKGPWRLVIEEGLSDDEDSWRVTPLVDCSRERRAAVFEQWVPRLLDLGLEQMAKRIAERQAAIRSAELLVNAGKEWSAAGSATSKRPRDQE